MLNLLATPIAITPVAAPVPSAAFAVDETDGYRSCVTSFADCDGDAVRDLAIADRSTPSANRVWVLSGKTGRLLFEIHGAPETLRFGQALADAGDIDGDRRGDLIVGSGNGPVTVHSGADGHVLLALKPPSGTIGFGFALAGAVDVDGDHVPDIAVGAPGRDGAPTRAVQGAAFLFAGKDGRLIRGFHQEAEPTPEDLVPDDADLAVMFGSSVCFVGDLDGDKVNDLVIGSPYALDLRSTQHRVTRKSDGKSFIRCPRPGRVDAYSGASGKHLFAAIGPEADTFGWSTAPAGDVDHDGHPDFVVACLGHGLCLVSGKDGSLLQRCERNYGSLGALGTSLERLGDIDGDGHDEFVVGACEAETLWESAESEIVSLDPTKRCGYRKFALLMHPETAGVDVCAVGDVDGDGSADAAFVIIPRPAAKGKQTVRMVSVRSMNTLWEVALPLEAGVPAPDRPR